MALFLAGTVAGGVAVGAIFLGSLATANRLAPAERRGQAISAFFVACYAGLIIPVVGVGVLVRHRRPHRPASPVLRGAITGGGTFAGGIFHSCRSCSRASARRSAPRSSWWRPNCSRLAWLRHKYFQTSFARSFVAVAVGGTIIASLSAGLGVLATA